MKTNNPKTINKEQIENKIYTIRGVQVMLDRDLAELYQVETRRINEQVKRNIERFPDDFMFQLTKDELEIWKSQNATSNSIKMGLRKMPWNSHIFDRFERIEYKLVLQDKKIERIFNTIEDKNTKPTQGIFYEGQIFDAYVFVNDLLKRAKNRVVLIDNYIDESILTLFGKYPEIQFTIITKPLSKQLKLDINKYNSQYENLKIKTSNTFHDRFLIIDDAELYHIGASLKDLGKKVFAFSKMDEGLLETMELLG